MRFGLVLGWLAILKKKIWADYEQLLRAVFSCFQGKNHTLHFFAFSPAYTTHFACNFVLDKKCFLFNQRIRNLNVQYYSYIIIFVSSTEFYNVIGMQSLKIVWMKDFRKQPGSSRILLCTNCTPWPSGQNEFTLSFSKVLSHLTLINWGGFFVKKK